MVVVCLICFSYHLKNWSDILSALPRFQISIYFPEHGSKLHKATSKQLPHHMKLRTDEADCRRLVSRHNGHSLPKNCCHALPHFSLKLGVSWHWPFKIFQIQHFQDQKERLPRLLTRNMSSYCVYKQTIVLTGHEAFFCADSVWQSTWTCQDFRMSSGSSLWSRPYMSAP